MSKNGGAAKPKRRPLRSVTADKAYSGLEIVELARFQRAWQYHGQTWVVRVEPDGSIHLRNGVVLDPHGKPLTRNGFTYVALDDWRAYSAAT